MEIIFSASDHLNSDSSLLLKTLLYIDAPFSFSLQAGRGELCLTGPLILDPSPYTHSIQLVACLRNGSARPVRTV